MLLTFSQKSAHYPHPLREFGMSVFPRGSYFTGRFVDYKDPSWLVGKGWMKLEFDRLVLCPTLEVPIAAKVVSVRGYRMDAEGRILGRGHPRCDAYEWTLPILWPIKLMTLPARDHSSRRCGAKTPDPELPGFEALCA